MAKVRTKRTDTHCQSGHEFTAANSYFVQGRRRCRKCQAAKVKAWRLAHRDDPRYKAARCASATRSYRKHTARRLGHARKRLTGFTPEEYDAKFLAQDGLCAICRSGAASRADHNHVTKKTRGLLCNRCNMMLGYMEKTPKLVAACMAYLERWA